jgi:hypothetical protein
MPNLQLVNGSYIVTQRRNIAPGRIGFVTENQAVSATVELTAANFDAVSYGAAGCVLHPGFGFKVESPLQGSFAAQRDQGGTTVVTVTQADGLTSFPWLPSPVINS